MINLEQQDVQRLIEILQKLPEFGDENSRRAFLSYVGLGTLLPRMDLSGSPAIASMKVIHFLLAYGQLQSGSALGSLLSGMKAFLGATEPRVIDEILVKYQLMQSLAQSNNNPGGLDRGEVPGRAEKTKIETIGPVDQPVSSRAQVRKVFISYSRADRQCLDTLKTQLALLESQKMFELWDDTKILAGTPWKQAIGDALDLANVAILLVSASFLASDFIMRFELPRLLERHAQSQLVLLPLVISHCLYKESPLGEIQAFNPVNKPLNTLTHSQVEEVFVRLARAIQRAIQ